MRTASAKIVTNNDNEKKTLANEISDRLSEELVFALVGPVGSGVSTAAGLLAEILKNKFDYDVCPIIKMSDFIKAEGHRVGLSATPKEPLNEYVKKMQDAGNELRLKFGGNYLAEKAIEAIAKFRKQKGGYRKDNGALLPGRRAYVIDSIKNMEELSLLRQIYRETLCVFGIFAPDAIRRKRLVDAGAVEKAVSEILDRDQGEVPTFGQMTRKIFVQSDFFICNDLKQDELRRRIERYLEIIFDVSIHTPTKHEFAMYEASAAMASSACMSRQVGASIISVTGELISVGWNDVPKFQGGLYTEDDQIKYDPSKNGIHDGDHRCFRWGGKICHNETRRTSILDNMARRIHGSQSLKIKASEKEIRKVLDGTEVDDLTEYSRSIHAEMEAILAIAREGKHSLVGATMYTTTYPCHNCARHIVAAGITKVIYIEPYRKSLATVLHSDAITEDPNDKARVVFSQYDGISPHHYLNLFKPAASRKNDGKYDQKDPSKALPRFRVPLDGFVDYESKVIADLVHKEQ